MEDEDLELDGEESGEDEEAEDRPRAGEQKPLQVLKEITPGTVYLKTGMGRKQTGSFYTSRPLVEFLVRKAIDPLVQGKTPGEILSLKVVDPAMGSGHFLVGACRLLAEHLLAAYRKMYDQAITEQPDLPLQDVFHEAGIHPEVAANWEHEDRALTACRLLVAGNCIYGVDKNPLAVDLARVSLWLATAATDHPLTFLDHRLLVGDSLLGLPLYLGGGEEPEVHLLKPLEPPTRGHRRSRRSGGDAADMFKGVSMMEVVSKATQHLRERVRRSLLHLKTISELMDDRPGNFLGHRAAFESMQEELQVFDMLHALRIGREFLPPKTAVEYQLVNTWLTEISNNDYPSEESFRMGEPAMRRGRELGAFCWHLAFPEVFFSPESDMKERPGFDAIIGNPPWDKIKPNERECFSDFDPTVWDVQGQERKRLITRIMDENSGAKEAWEKHETETKIYSKILLDGGLYHHQIAVVEGKKTGGDPDTFKFFTERAYQLLKHGGRAGIIVPLGIQGSLSTTGLRRLLLDQSRLVSLVKLDNERFIFPGVFHGQKFDLLVFSKGGRTDRFDAAFLSWEPGGVLARIDGDPRYLNVDADLYRELSPEQYTFVELHDQREVELLRRIYRQFPKLGERLEDTWNVSFTAEFHMTNDSFLFRDAERLRAFDAVLHSRLPSPTEAAAGALFEPDEGGEYWTTQSDDYYAADHGRFARAERWVDSKGRVNLPGAIPEERIAHRMTGYVLVGEEDHAQALPIRSDEKYMPLYEGRMVHQFDHCQKAYVSGSGRRARWQELEWHKKRIVPHFFLSENEYTGICSNLNCRVGFCDVTGQANERSTLACIVPKDCPSGNSVPTITHSDGLLGSLLFCSIMNSFVFDFLLRKTVSNHLNFFILTSLPVPRVTEFDQNSPGIIRKAGKLVCTTHETWSLWEELANKWHEDFPVPWSFGQALLDTSVRSRLRAEIDARISLFYGLTSHEYARIIATFPAMDQDQPRLPGDAFIRQTNRGEKVTPRSFITRDLALLTFFEMSGEPPPEDIVSFFADAGIDIERNTGPIRDLRTRVDEAGKRGAVAYLPTIHRGWRPQDTPFLPPGLPPDLVENWEGNIGSHVITDPQVNSGELTLAGTRIEVKLIHDLLKQGWTFKQVLDSYPHLSEKQISVALRWGDLL